jgi:hypothetical protein
MQRSLNRTHIAEGVASFEGIVEVLAFIEDARKAITSQHLRAENLGPEVFDLLALAEEPMAANVEPIATGCDGPRDAADEVWIALNHCDWYIRSSQLVRCGQARRTCAHDHNLLFVRHLHSPPSTDSIRSRTHGSQARTLTRPRTRTRSRTSVRLIFTQSN